MNSMKLNLEAIRANMGISRADMAKLLEVTVDRYNRLANGESRMFATELIRLHNISGVPFENIALPE